MWQQLHLVGTIFWELLVGRVLFPPNSFGQGPKINFCGLYVLGTLEDALRIDLPLAIMIEQLLCLYLLQLYFYLPFRLIQLVFLYLEFASTSFSLSRILDNICTTCDSVKFWNVHSDLGRREVAIL